MSRSYHTLFGSRRWHVVCIEEDDYPDEATAHADLALLCDPHRFASKGEADYERRKIEDGETQAAKAGLVERAQALARRAGVPTQATLDQAAAEREGTSGGGGGEEAQQGDL